MNAKLPQIVKTNVSKKFKTPGDIVLAGATIETGMSMFGTDMDRSTHYNTKQDLEQARHLIHDQVFSLDRSIYGCLMCIPGVSDISKMTAITKMLDNPWTEDTRALLSMKEERMIMDTIVSELPANRMINLFKSFTIDKINNQRTRNTALPFILNYSDLDWWAVKYRRKLRNALSHCWGNKLTHVIKIILGKERKNEKDREILIKNVEHYLVKQNHAFIYECLAFILFARTPSQYTNKLFKSYYEARTDFSKAVGLPKEVIEGIRGIYHKEVDRATTLKIAEKSMTTKEKKLVQNQAKKAGVKVEWNPFSQSLVDLFIYGFKMGFTPEIYSAIGAKAKAAATLLPFKYDHVGILCDDSFSMSGSNDQKLRALAVTYATVQMLRRVAENCTIKTTSGREFIVTNSPEDGTDLASPLIQLLKVKPDAIFVVSDGYENAPEGRFGEVLKIVRDRLNDSTPIYHFNPVSAAESKVALKKLSNDIPLTPVSDPEKMGLSLFKTMLSVDPRGGIIELFNMILPQIERSKTLYAARCDIKALAETKKIDHTVEEGVV